MARDCCALFDAAGTAALQPVVGGVGALAYIFPVNIFSFLTVVVTFLLICRADPRGSAEASGVVGDGER